MTVVMAVVVPAAAVVVGGFRYVAQWRDNVFFEYYYVEPNFKCVEDCAPLKPGQEYPNTDSNCGDLTPLNNSVCWGGGG